MAGDDDDDESMKLVFTQSYRWISFETFGQ